MSLYDDASLVMIPSGYKDGKLYSAKPTNGDGDFTFSRGSNLAATRVNSEGLIEKGRENLLLQSNSFDTTWVTSSASVNGGQTGYDGSSDAWLLSKTGDYGRVEQNTSASGIYTLSVYAKSGTLDWLSFENSGISADTCFFDLSNGVLGSKGAGVVSTSIQSIGNGWYRCSAIFNGAFGISRIQPSISDGVVNGTNGNIYIQDAQLEVGLVSTDVITTTTTTEQAGILEDMPRLDYSGGASCPALKLEPQRSNLITQSEYIGTSNEKVTITYNDATSPEGVNNAVSIVEDSQNGRHRTQTNSFSVTSGNAYTLTLFAKIKSGTRLLCINADTVFNARAYFDLVNGDVEGTDTGSASIEDYGNGWYRCILTGTATVTRSSIAYIGLEDGTSDSGYQGDGTSGHYWYGLQVEAGSYPTSYIPTYGGSSVTRGADELDLINWVSKGIISDSNEWTIFYEVDGLTTDYDTGDSQWLPGDDNTIDVYMRAGATNENFARFYWRKDSKYIGSTYGKKIIARLSGGTGTTFADGVEIASSSISGDYSNIGMNMGTSSNAAGYVKQAIIFPTALTDAECIELTTI